MNRESKLRWRILIAAAIAVLACVWDCLEPTATAALGYLVAIALVAAERRLTYAAAGACSVGLLLAYVISGSHGSWSDLDERLVALAAIWLLSWAVSVNARVERAGQDQALDRKSVDRFKEEEKKYRLVLKNISDAVFLTDEHGAFTYVSPSVVEVFGWSREEVLDLRTVDRLFNGTFPLPAADARSSEIRNREHTLLDRFGRRHTLLTHCKRVAIGDSAFLFTSRDITDRKTAEAGLSEANQLLEAMFSSMQEAVLVLRASDRKILRCNPAVETIFGYRPEDLCGQTTRVLYDSDASYEEAVRIRDQALRETSVFSTEVRLRRQDGRLIDIESTVSSFHDIHGETHIVAAIRDITERKRADEALRESEARYRAAVEDQTEFVVRWNPDGIRTFANEAYCRYWLLSRDQVVGTPFEDLIWPEDRDRVWESLAALGTAQPTGIVEHRVKHPDGTLRWQEWTNHGIFDAQGHLIEYQSVGRDVTARKEAEENLRRQNEILQSIFDHAQVMICFVDANKGVIKINREVERVLGWKQQDTNLMDILTSVYPDGSYREQVYEFIRRGEGIFADFKSTRKDGVVVDTSWANVLLSDGVSLGIGVNITQRKQAEEALRQHGELLQTIFDHAPVMIAYMDPSQTVRLMNRQFERTLGYSLKDVQAGDFWQRMYPDERERQSALEYIRLGRMSRERFRVRTKDGRLLDTTWVNAVLSDGTNIGIGEDITERLRAETRQREQENELARVSRLTTVGELASGIAHELNQPLTAVLNYASATRRMLSEDGGGERVIPIIEKASDQARRASEIVSWLNGFVRRSEGKHGEVDVNSAVRQAIQLLAVEAEKAGIRVLLHLDEELPRCHGDDIQLQQVVLNLARNGLEAMVQAASERRDLEISSCRASSSTIGIAVRDSGPGIPPDKLMNIFEPFYTTKAEGLGVGLSISRSIVTAHGGRLWATNNPDGGASFHFTVPVYQEGFAHEERGDRTHCG